MHSLMSDIRYAARTLARGRAFTALAILTVALGVGASTAIFSMVEGVLLKRLPYAANDRLVRLEQPSTNSTDDGFSVPELGDYRAQVPELDAVAIEPLRDFQCAVVNFGVIGAMNGTFDRPRDDLLRAVILRGVLDNPVAQQRPVLHQTKHNPSRFYFLAHDRRPCERPGA